MRGEQLRDSVAHKWVSHSLVRIGAHGGGSIGRLLNGATNFLETGRSMKEASLTIPSPAPSRAEVFDVGVEVARAAAQPLYLEFGVWEGKSIAYWARQLQTPAARFVGFDSFEGLPDDWTHEALRGHFSTAGQTPETQDSRVSFERGWFADTVPGFDLPEHDLCIINVDCDLYGSAKTVLGHVGKKMEVGDLLYFDEFHDRLHEGLAFKEFSAETGYRFEVLAATAGLTNVLLHRTA